MPGALAGVKIIDLTSVVMGPYATQILADWGADVVKVEAPDGDVVRAVAPARTPGMGALFLNANRNKRSVCIDLKHVEGAALLKRLVADADVFVSNVRPHAMRKLGLGGETLAALNPRLIQANLTGFGQDGPYAQRPAYDDLIQGASGVSFLGQRGDAGDAPRYVPLALADRVTGLMAAAAISAALFERERSGMGQVIEVPMFETMASFVLADHLGGLTHAPQSGAGGYQRLLSKDRRPFETADGYLCAVVYTDRQWSAFLAEIGARDLMQTDPRFSTFAARTRHIDHVYAYLAGVFRSRTTAAWLEALERAGVPAAPMHTLESLLADPHLRATGFLQTLDHPSEGALRTTAPPNRWSRTPGAVRCGAPRLGEHSRAVLSEFGLTDAEIAELLRAGVIREAAPC